MEFTREEAEIFVPDGVSLPDALQRTTHLCVGAHQDDQEFMAYHGIQTCFGDPKQWFTGVVLTNGSGSARAGIYEAFTDHDMQDVRRREQRKAAVVGEYACQVQLGFASSDIKNPEDSWVTGDLVRIFEATRPDVVYLHNPADKHDTHVAAVLRSLAALRALPAEHRPAEVFGCEIWRSLDWLLDEDKQVLPVHERPNLAGALSGLFDSQISGGKRYDTAVMGRRAANATFFESHATDTCDALSWAMDLKPLVDDPALSVAAYTETFIERFKEDVMQRIGKLEG